LGIYEPPFGVVGKTRNAIVSYRIAEVSVHHFLNHVAGYLRQALAERNTTPLTAPLQTHLLSHGTLVEQPSPEVCSSKL
jgi:hypothetical protein